MQWIEHGKNYALSSSGDLHTHLQANVQKSEPAETKNLKKNRSL